MGALDVFGKGLGILGGFRLAGSERGGMRLATLIPAKMIMNYSMLRSENIGHKVDDELVEDDSFRICLNNRQVTEAIICGDLIP